MKKTLYFTVIILFLAACGSPTTVKKTDPRMLLAQALANKDFTEVQVLRKSIRMTENAQNLINLYSHLFESSPALLNPEISYLQQFYSSMNENQQSMNNQLATWVYLKQIYQHEISPPVRILQRSQLYLAPSKIDFNRCPDTKHDCAHEIRKLLMPIMNDNNVFENLKKMATKDPCVNLSLTLKGHDIANRCLRKSKGNLVIEILAKPAFNQNFWRSVISQQ
jgi:hypothetical protein